MFLGVLLHVGRYCTYKGGTATYDEMTFVSAFLADDGLHGPRRRCGVRRLNRGNHRVKSVGFQRGGGAYMRMMYGGPDTGGFNKKRYMHSVRYRAYSHGHKTHHSRFDKRGWKIKIFKGPKGMSRVPSNTRGMRHLGSAIVQSINLPNENFFKHKIPRTPHDDFVWVISGHLRIRTNGIYRFCTKSDDGSKMWIDRKQVVNNDGLHGPRRRCSHR